jgi:hypothetical protein
LVSNGSILSDKKILITFFSKFCYLDHKVAFCNSRIIDVVQKVRGGGGLQQ